MSEQELNAILEEIKNRGRQKNEENLDSSNEINFDFNSATSRRSISEIKADEEPKAQESVVTPKEEIDLILEKFMPVQEEKAEEIVFNVEEEQVVSKEIEEPTITATFVDEKIEESPIVEEEIQAVEKATSIEKATSEEASIPSEDEYEEIPPVKDKNSTKKRIIISAVVIAIVAIAVAVACIFAGKHAKVEPPTTKEPATEIATQPTTEAPAVVDTTPKNPLTGEHKYNQAAIGKRPVAVVVENEYSTSSVRPQWGLADADIVLEGESEYSTRLLLFWADYTTVPKQVGPARSARPPFIRFSELFDCVFIHAGLSRSKGNYVGADSVFQKDNVDHINLLQTSGDGTYFGRDKSRTSTIEHTGYLNGTNVAKMLGKYNIKTDFDPTKYTQLSFNEEAVDLSTTKANSVSFKWSGSSNGGRCPKTGKFSYNAQSKKYTTTDFDSKYGKANVEWENLVFLLDTTTYVEKNNYKGNHTEVYCNYSLSSGKGMIVSNGTAVNITWGVKNGKLWFKDASGNDVKLNPGKTYIGYGSQNHGGYISINDNEGA